MSDNKEVIRRMFSEIVNEGRVELIDELFDPEFETDGPSGVLDRDGFKEFVAGWRAGFSDIHTEITGILAEGDMVAWGIVASGTNDGPFMGAPATGRSVSFDSLNIAHFRDGKAYRHKVVMDMVTLMTQLGAMPAPA